jgi:hypothetical protein
MMKCIECKVAIEYNANPARPAASTRRAPLAAAGRRGGAAGGALARDADVAADLSG